MEKYTNERKYHYLYKITNLVNNKYYYGIHSTDNLEDGYMGSGVRLKAAYAKYGIFNFRKEIISFYKNRKELLDAERDIVNESLLTDKNCYNVAIGGKGQFCFKSKEQYSVDNKKAWLTRKQNENWKDAFVGYNNPEFIGRCKEKYEYNKDEMLKWYIKTNVPDAIIEKFFNKQAHQHKVTDYFINSGILPKPIKVEKIRYESGYKRKSYFSEDVLSVYFIDGSNTSKRVNKLVEIIKFVKDDSCTDSQVFNFKKYDFTKADISFFEELGIVEKTGVINIKTNSPTRPFGERTLYNGNINKEINLIDKELNRYEFNDDGKLIQKGKFIL